MRGNFVKLTIGDYLDEVPGFISSLTYNITEQTPWDIGRDINGDRDEEAMILPQIIEVGCSFTPVQNFLPKKSKSWTTTYGENGNIDEAITSPFISMRSKDNIRKRNERLEIENE